MRRLISELRTEMLGEPDDEHTQVSVSNEHWAVTAQVSGLITFDNMDILEGVPSDLPEVLYLRDIPDAQLIQIWQSIVRGDDKFLADFQWCPADKVPPFSKNYYRTE